MVLLVQLLRSRYLLLVLGSTADGTIVGICPYPVVRLMTFLDVFADPTDAVRIHPNSGGSNNYKSLYGKVHILLITLLTINTTRSRPFHEYRQ